MDSRSTDMRIRNKTKAQLDHEYWFRKKAKRPLIIIPDIPNEEWKQVVGYENSYLVSNMGRIKSVKRIKVSRGLPYEHPEKIISPSGKKYKTACLFKMGSRKYLLVHRLVAEAFIPNPDNKAEVNHKDGNKTNNLLTNLEWCTRLENQKHAEDTGLRNLKGGNHPRSKKIGMYSMNDSLIKQFDCLTDVKRLGKFKTIRIIADAATGNRESAYNHKWKYL